MSLGANKQALMGAAGAAGGGGTTIYDYQIAHSVRMNGSNQYFNRTAGIGSTNSDKKAISVWYKRAGTTGNTPTQYIMSSQQDRLAALFVNDGSNADNFGYFTDNGGQNGKSKFLQRDFSAWYHLVFLYNSTLATGVDRVKVYINGVHYTTADPTFWNVDNNGYPGSGTQIGFGMNGNQNNIGRYQYNGTGYFNGYLADFIMIDGGTVPSISDFGETKNGVWVPKDPSTLTFGNNGFWLKFQNSSALGDDSSGNNNDWTANNFSTHDQMLDTPTFNSDSNGGNFATYNPLQEKGDAAALMVLTEGSLQAESVTNDKYHQITGNMGVKTGKWYIEWYIKAAGYPSWAVGWNHGNFLGTFNGNSGLASIANMQYMGYFTGSNVYITNFGNTSTGNPQVPTASFTNQGAPTTGDVIMCAIDNDAGKCWWGINGVWGNIGSGTGNPATGANASATWTIANYTDYKFPFTLSWANPVAEIVMNCGQEGTFGGAITAGGNADDTGYGNFKYDVPAGFLAMCSGNLPVANAIDPAQTSSNFPQKMFGILTYTGDGSATQAQTGLGFKPDWTWIKQRNGTAGHKLFDSTRGVTKYVNSANSDAETTETDSLKVFGADGFSVGSNAGTGANSSTYVGWNWRANGGTTSTNDSGSVDTTVQTDPSGAFSVVTWAGSGGAATLGHGLSGAPTFMAAKSRTSGATVMDWPAFHKNMNNGAFPANESRMYWDSTGGYGTGALWQTNNNSSTVFGVTSNISNSSKNYVAYCFTDVEGYIKAGSYVGNANADGTFVYTGFKPAWIMIKKTNSTSNWNIFDTTRDPFNYTSKHLTTDSHAQEYNGVAYSLDILSNGFKLRATWTSINNGNFIYLAFAENPFKYATAR